MRATLNGQVIAESDDIEIGAGLRSDVSSSRPPKDKTCRDQAATPHAVLISC
jgi:hypothetical protein